MGVSRQYGVMSLLLACILFVLLVGATSNKFVDIGRVLFNNNTLSSVQKNNVRKKGANTTAVATTRTTRNYLQEIPTREVPFIFFHIPKSGGTSLRSVLHKRCTEYGLGHFIPCETPGIGCRTTEDTIKLDINQARIQANETHGSNLRTTASCAEVFAGHFTSALIPKLVSLVEQQKEFARLSVEKEFSNNNINRHDQLLCTRGQEWMTANMDLPVSPTFTCYISFRDPISRFASHYNHFTREGPESDRFGNRTFTSLSVDEIRYVGNYGANVQYNYLTRHLDVDGSNKNNYTSEEKMNLAENLIQKCIVGITEDADTSAKLLETALPWLQGAVRTAPRLNVRVSDKSHHGTMKDLSPDVENELRSMLSLDIELYHKRVLPIYNAQLKRYGIARNYSTPYLRH